MSSATRFWLIFAGFCLCIWLLLRHYGFGWQVLIIAYTAASLLAFIQYAWDKRAAVNQQRRIPENWLHLTALLGGWPGALIAQQLLRHKTQKVFFRWIFWLTVLINMAALAAAIWRNS